MLFDFHKWQNEKQPGTIHATYLLYGVKKQEITNSQAQQDGDVEMSGSLHETESNPETVPTFVMSLVKEEDLKG
jgi:DNA polymerase delta subunit 3